MIMLILMTLTMIIGHSWSAEENILRWIILISEQATSIEVDTTVGLFLSHDLDFDNIGLTMLLFILLAFSIMKHIELDAPAKSMLERQAQYAS